VFVSVVPVGQLVGVHALVHLHVLLLLLLHSFVQVYVAYVPCVPLSDVPDGQLWGVQFPVHQQVLLAVPPQPSEQVTVFEPYEVELLDKGEQLQLVGTHCQLALISILPVTLLHTPVDELNEPPHDPLIIEKPLNVYPALVHVTASEAVPLHLLCDVGEQVPPFPFTVILYFGK